MLKVSLSALLMLLGSHVIAAPQDWMKKDNPDELGKLVEVPSVECGITKEQLSQKVDGEFLRARIKPIVNYELQLYVKLVCMDVKNVNGTSLGKAAHYQISFLTLHGARLVSYVTADYGTLMVSGNNGEAAILNSVGNGVANALTDYLKANYK